MIIFNKYLLQDLVETVNVDPWMQNHRYRVLTVKLYTDFQLGREDLFVPLELYNNSCCSMINCTSIDHVVHDHVVQCCSMLFNSCCSMINCTTIYRFSTGEGRLICTS